MEDIQRLAERRIKGERRKASRRRIRPTPVIIDWLSPDDIPAILRLDKIVYDEMFLAEMERYRQWSVKNGQLARAAFDARSNRQTMLAYIACLPLDESVILQIMRGEREEISITANEIQSYERQGSYTLLVNSAVVHPDHPYLLRHVLQNTLDSWVDRYPERYVTRVYAQSVSERGDLLISSFFLQPRYDLAPNAYMLDLARPGRSKIIRNFQEALRAKAPFPFNDRLETAPPFSFEADTLPTPFDRPTLILTARQDHLCGYKDAWNLLDNYPRATFAVLDGAGHFVNIEQDVLCQALMSEWLDRVEAYTTA